MKYFSFLLTVLCSGILLAQNVHTVDNNSPSAGDFTTIAAAITAASPGDTIYIQPSPEAYGNVTITKLLHLRGAGHAPLYTNGMAAELGSITLNIPIGGNGITISGLRFGNLGVTGTQQYPNLEIINCRTGRIAAGNGVDQCNNWVLIGNVISVNTPNIMAKGNSNGWVVSNNYIRQEGTAVSWSIFQNFNTSDIVRNNVIVNAYANDSGAMFNGTTGLLVENSIILFNGNSTGLNLSGNTVTFNNSLNYSYVGQTLTALPGNNNLNNQDPLFVSVGTNPNYGATKDFSLQASSPGAGHGTDGQDIGLFGSDFNFSPRGYAFDLPYITKMEVTNAVVGQGGVINVNFEATAQ